MKTLLVVVMLLVCMVTPAHAIAKQPNWVVAEVKPGQTVEVDINNIRRVTTVVRMTQAREVTLGSSRTFRIVTNCATKQAFSDATWHPAATTELMLCKKL